MNKKLVILLIGPPGAGKGTQAQLLAEKKGLYHFETSKLLERIFNEEDDEKVFLIKGKEYPLKKERKLWKNGDICTPSFVSYLVQEKVKELSANNENLVFSGSPRSLGEAKELVPLLESLYGKENIKVFVLEIPAQETIFRNSHRRICSLMRHSILYSEETKNLKHCPLDGSELVKRKGLDDPETIKIRLKIYEEKTMPIISYFKERGLSVKEIDGKGSVADVFQRLEKNL